MAGSQEKTEQPTGKRLGEARNRGQVAKSRDLIAVGVLLTGTLATWASRNFMFDHFRRMLQVMWSPDAFNIPGYPASSGFASDVIVSFCLMIAPIVVTIMVTAVVLNIVQLKGFIFSFEAMHLGLSNLNPISGFKRMVSLRSFAELVKSALKVLIISWGVYSILWPERNTLFELSGAGISDLMYTIGLLGLRVTIRVSAIMLILSLLDFLYQKWQNKRDLMMTRQEIKEESKQSEGNPQVKSKIRSIQRALVKQRMLAKVRKASVIITNPTHYAVALYYKPGMEAPTLVAKGMDFLALKIKDIGRKHGVPIIESPPLARALYKQVKLDESIPIGLYRAVAKILAYVYQQKQSLRRN